jgi:hypothetical protein
MFMNKVRSQAKPVRRAFLAVAISAAAVLSSVGVAAPASANEMSGCWIYEQTSRETVTVRGYYWDCFGGVPSNMEIPSFIDGRSVTAIGTEAFNGLGLESVTIPSSVTSIGEAAFAHNALTTMTIPNSVTQLGEYAFEYNKLTSVTLPSSLTSIGSLAFAFNSLASLTIPSSVTSISDRAFNVNKLTSLTIPNSVTSIGKMAFAENELTSLTLSTSVNSIGESAFQWSKLTSLTIPDSVTNIDAGAFSWGSLTSVKFGKSVASIGSYAFGFNALKSISFPASLTSLGEAALYRNPLTSAYFAGNGISYDGLNGPFSFAGPQDDFATGAKICFIRVATGSTGWDDSFGPLSVVPVGRSATCKPASAPVIRSIARIDADWTGLTIWAPKNNGGSKFMMYQYSSDNGATWNMANQDSDTRLSIYGLPAGSPLAIKVRAATPAGYGAASKVVKYTPQALASVPVIESITPDSGKVLVKVADPAAGGSKITRYGYSLNGKPIVGAGSASASGSFWIKGLKPGVSVSIRVFAATKAGWSDASEPMQTAARK